MSITTNKTKSWHAKLESKETTIYVGKEEESYNKSIKQNKLQHKAIRNIPYCLWKGFL